MPNTKLIDTHCHLNFHKYNDDRDAVLQRANNAGVNRVIIPAIDLESCQEAIDLSQQYDRIFIAVGIHPNYTVGFDDGTLNQVRDWASHEKVVSIGEIGLDYHWDKSPKDVQRKAFEQQLELATTLELPVIIHNREASTDVMDVLESWVTTLPNSLKHRPGVLHSFSAPPEIAERALAIGFYLGFTGPITFKKADDLRAVAITVPLNRILVETDGPFLTPHPYRGKRNEPAYVQYMTEKLAELHNISYEQMAHHTTVNAEHLFNFPTKTEL
jgi:TatD DNase family protein